MSSRGGTSVDGSAIVAAVVVAAIVGLLAASVVARSTGAVTAAVAAGDRAEARRAAEVALRIALLDLEHGSQRRAIVDRTTVDAGALRAAATRGLRTDGRLTVHVEATPGDAADVRRIDVGTAVGDATAQATAVVRPRLTIDHLWLTEHQAIDPVLHQGVRVGCTYPEGDHRRSDTCRTLTLGPLDLDGPAHSNEALVFAQGTTYRSDVTTSVPLDGAHAVAQASEAVGPFGIAHRPQLRMPRSLAAMRVDGSVTCRFRGPTSLRFVPGGVRVRSPRSVPRPGDTAEGMTPLGCVGIDLARLDTVLQVPLPSGAVIEIVDDPVTSCAEHPLGLEHDEDADRAWGCSSGDAFVWGDASDGHTVLAEHNIQIVWDLIAEDVDGAVMGLVAGDSIVLRRPVGRPIRRVAPYGRNIAFAGPGIPPFGSAPLDAPTSQPATWESPRLDAALAALRGSVAIQNPLLGEPHAGPVTLRGSLASRFTPLLRWEHRGRTGAIVATTGYELDLSYASALGHRGPPAMPMTDGARLRILELDVG